MKNILAALLIVIMSSCVLFSRQRQQPARRPNAVPPAIEDVIEGFYVSQFPQQIDVSDGVFAKILPILRQALRERREISVRRTRSLNQLRMLVQQGGSDEDIKRLIREVDKADADAQASQEKFLTTVDPLLDARQQAKLRIFQVMIEQRIRRMIDRARAPAQNRQTP